MTSTPTPKLLALGVAGVLALGGGTAAVATAATDAPSAAKGPTPEKRAAARAERQKAFADALGVSVEDVQKARETVRAAGAERRAEREKAVAEKQGITVEQLRDRRADRLEKRLDKAVENDRISQAQADELVAAVRAGKPVKAQRKKLQRELRQDRREDREERRDDRQADRG